MIKNSGELDCVINASNSNELSELNKTFLLNDLKTILKNLINGKYDTNNKKAVYFFEDCIYALSRKHYNLGVRNYNEIEKALITIGHLSIKDLVAMWNDGDAKGESWSVYGIGFFENEIKPVKCSKNSDGSYFMIYTGIKPLAWREDIPYDDVHDYKEFRGLNREMLYSIREKRDSNLSTQHLIHLGDL